MLIRWTSNVQLSAVYISICIQILIVQDLSDFAGSSDDGSMCCVMCAYRSMFFLLTTRHIPPPSSGELLKTARRKQINCSHCLFLAIRLSPHPNTNKRKKQKLDERGKKPRNWRIPDAPHFQLPSACRCRVCLSSQFDQGATPNPSSWFNHGLCGHAGRVTPFFFSSTSSGGRVRENMERQGMEGNNLLHFLDTPSAHYRRLVVFYPSSFRFYWCNLLLHLPHLFILGMHISKEMTGCWFAPLCLEGHATDLRPNTAAMNTLRHQVCECSVTSSFPVSPLWILCGIFYNISLLFRLRKGYDWCYQSPLNWHYLKL